MTRGARAAAVRAGVVRAVALALLTAALFGCANEPRTTYLPNGGPAGDLTDATEAVVIGALGDVGLTAAEAQLPYRPPEAALLSNAPRTVIQAALPDDPNHGFVVIYALQSPQAADAAGADQAAFIESNRGGSFARTSRFSLRVGGSTVVFFWWVPETVIDQRTALVEEALLGVGSEVPIAR
jgi:hypothetical protein